MKQTSRRKFITAVAALTGTTIVPGIINAKPGTENTTWDLPWLNKMGGKHKQVFDCTDTQSLRIVRNWLDAYKEVFRIDHGDLGAIIGIARKAFPVNASDALYRSFPIGEHWKVEDPETKKPALRNIFLEGGKTPADQAGTVRALQARGVVFWQCNKALQRVAKDLSELVKRPEADVYEELKAGLNPGVILIPAHAMLIGLAQEQGFTYELV